MTSLDDFETKLNQVSLSLSHTHTQLPHFLYQALERNAILENELDEKDQLSVACQRLKDEVRGIYHNYVIKLNHLSYDLFI